MSISSHLGIVLLVIVGVVTIIGVIVIGAVETKRMEKGEPSVLSKPPEQQSNETEKKK